MKNPDITTATIRATIVDGKECYFKAEYYYGGHWHVRNLKGVSGDIWNNKVAYIAVLKDDS